MTHKYEKYTIRSNDFPKNIKRIRDKIIFIIYLEGMVERKTFAIDNVKTMSIRQAIVDLRSAGLIKIYDGYIGLTEDGLKKYSSSITPKIDSIIRHKHVLSVFINNDDHPIGSRDICDKLLLETDDKRRVQVTKALGVLKKKGLIVEYDSYLNYRKYLLVDSDAGRDHIKKLKVPENKKAPLDILFQLALPGTLTASDVKPYFC